MFRGAIGAIVLRVILTFFAVSLLQLSYLKIIGGAPVWIGIKLIAEEEDEGGHDVQGSDPSGRRSGRGATHEEAAGRLTWSR